MRLRPLPVTVFLILSATICHAQTFYPAGALPDTALLELPALSPDDHIIIHEGYVSCYDRERLSPMWVAYELTADELVAVTEREGGFKKDPSYSGRQATNSDYLKKGFDKGHIAPAADFKWSVKAMNESFYFTNISPQHPTLNRRYWLKLEDLTREAAERFGSVWVISGTVCTAETPLTIGKNSVVVPDCFYKALMAKDGGELISVAFLLQNDGSVQMPEDVALSVDDLEDLTGLDLFRALPLELQEAEASADLHRWIVH